MVDLIKTDIMFEARLVQGALLKKVLEAIKDLLTGTDKMQPVLFRCCCKLYFKGTSRKIKVTEILKVQNCLK